MFGVCLENFFSWLILLASLAVYAMAHISNFIDLNILPFKSGYLLDRNLGMNPFDQMLFATASNFDTYQLTAQFSKRRLDLRFRGSQILQNDHIPVTVHVFNHEVDEKTKALHFLCHSSVSLTAMFVENYKSASSVCCIISVNTTYSHELTSCSLKLENPPQDSLCHSSIKLPFVLWKGKNSPTITISYVISTYQQNEELRKLRDNRGSLEKCHVASKYSVKKFIPFATATTVRSVPDAIRELGRCVLLQIPRRELRNNEEFVVPIRLKNGEDILDFTLRFEIPANSYVEFVRVIWPGGVTTTKQAASQYFDYPFDDTLQKSLDGSQTVWDIFHRSVLSEKRNITEIVARFREDLLKSMQPTKNSPATEVYKLLFRVNRPPGGAPGRVAPRIFWNLVSLSRRDPSDRTFGESPLVTRLNIESSELVHLAMVLKTSALVNLAALTGEPSVYPVWVYGLTYDSKIVDVTKRATCHTGDDAIIHFANDACDQLGFSGAELDGSPGLPLVAKLDGRSATVNLLVWFPKPPALRLTVDTVSQPTSPGDGINKMGKVVLKRLETEPNTVNGTLKNTICANNAVLKWNNTGIYCTFQPVTVRVLAKFILAGSVLYGKDVFGGKLDQMVDVTAHTAHRLRVDLISSGNETGSSSALDPNISSHYLKLVHLRTGDIQEGGTASPFKYGALNVPAHPTTTGIRISSPMTWLVGQRSGTIRLRLEPIDRYQLEKTIPPGLAKQLRDHLSELGEGNKSQPLSASGEQPSLEIHLTEESSVRPVGLSAQLVSDFAVQLSYGFDTNLEQEAFSSEQDVSSRTDLIPLYSGLYAVNFTLLGGTLVHSGSVNLSFARDVKSYSRGQSTTWRTVAISNTSGEASSTQRNDSMFLAIWIHLDDGSTILWNDMVELCRATKRPIPFKMAIENLHPEWIQLSGPAIHLRTRRRKRNVDALVNWYRGTSSYAQMVSFAERDINYHTEQSEPNALKEEEELQLDEKDKSRTDNEELNWSGPIVHVLRRDLSFTGNLLEIMLLSQSGLPLLPKLRVPATFAPASDKVNEYAFDDKNIFQRSSSSVQQESHMLHPNKESVANYRSSGEFLMGYSKYDSKHFPQLKVPSGLNVVEEDPGLMALKDAPGYRVHYPLQPSQHNSPAESTPNLRPPPAHAVALGDTSLSDQTGVEKTPVNTEEKHLGAHSTRLEETSTSRPALELSMYILLGLFALVGLVFAVNCGAVVARYRWERVGRLRDFLGTTHNVASIPSGSWTMELKIANNYSDVTQASPQVKNGNNNWMKKWKDSVIPHRNKSKSMLHKDTSWIWISRNGSSADQRETGCAVTSCAISDCTTLPISSPVVNEAREKQTWNRSFERARQCGTRQVNTTAVLSVGEADMLLMHSPYHQAASPDHLFTSLLPKSQYQNNVACNNDVSHRTNAISGQWQTDACGRRQSDEVHTLGRQSRRHTAGAIMQRNYQGQECSIRIISNPLSQHGTDFNPHFDTFALHQCNLNLSTNSTTPNCHLDSEGLFRYVANLTHTGSSSASIGRRRPNGLNMWTSHTGGRHPLYPPPSHPAPPIPVGHLDVHRHDQHPEGLMYRSWIRTKPNKHGQCFPTDSMGEEAVASHGLHEELRSEIPKKHVDEGKAVSPWQIRKAGRNKTSHDTTYNDKEKFLECSMQATPHDNSLLDPTDLSEAEALRLAAADGAPHPPIRTTSRTSACFTLQSRRITRTLATTEQRPMSLPQCFQATNEMYTALDPHTEVTTLSGLSVSHDKDMLVNTKTQSSNLKPSPSEESLWWYHPIKPQRKRKSHGISHIHSARGKEKSAVAKRCSVSTYTTHESVEATDCPDVLEYACPASCECDDLTSSLQSPPYGFERSTHSPDQPNASNLTVASELAWDRELLKLSHDRLVAYFASLKESTA